jgi:hypothetical protein
MRLKFI